MILLTTKVLRPPIFHQTKDIGNVDMFPNMHAPHESESQRIGNPKLPCRGSVPQYASPSSGRTNGSVSSESAPSPTPAQAYQYDSSYHKAARFAVGALAFDDVSVSVAVDYLKKSLELLTIPSAGQ
ncbi:hypothetical protein SAY87_031667 [Trapa incisa]|uniref:Vta1 C-terminal domain-containing protein n=1 Tax=Trapa incisa TaxID=236973 RepID=A0AAN7KQM0_9MYRT|nr:hypothetical protein SAY87_031667 [Trapa incisa]